MFDTGKPWKRSSIPGRRLYHWEGSAQEMKPPGFTPVAPFAGLLVVTDGLVGAVGWMPVSEPLNVISATLPYDPAGETYARTRNYCLCEWAPW